MKIQVTQEDIDRGIPGSWSDCPIAFAVNRAFNCEGTLVTYQIRPEYFNIGVHSKRFITPPMAREFIKEFDFKRSVLPFEFEIPDAIP